MTSRNSWGFSVWGAWPHSSATGVEPAAREALIAHTAVAIRAPSLIHLASHPRVYTDFSVYSASMFSHRIFCLADGLTSSRARNASSTYNLVVRLMGEVRGVEQAVLADDVEGQEDLPPASSGVEVDGMVPTCSVARRRPLRSVRRSIRSMSRAPSAARFQNATLRRGSAQRPGRRSCGWNWLIWPKLWASTKAWPPSAPT